VQYYGISAYLSAKKHRITGLLALPGALDTKGFLEMKKLTLQQDRLQLQKAN
jgi:hypothetical protein